MILLLTIESTPPLPVQDRVGAVADGLPGKRASFSGRNALLMGAQFTEPGSVSITQKFCRFHPRTKSLSIAFFGRVEMPLADVVVPTCYIEVGVIA